MSESEKAVALQPIDPEAVDCLGDVGLRHLGLSALSNLGVVDEETLGWDIETRVAVGGVVLPWGVDGVSIPDDYVMVRFTALVTPKRVVDNA